MPIFFLMLAILFIGIALGAWGAVVSKRPPSEAGILPKKSGDSPRLEREVLARQAASKALAKVNAGGLGDTPPKKEDDERKKAAARYRVTVAAANNFDRLNIIREKSPNYQTYMDNCMSRALHSPHYSYYSEELSQDNKDYNSEKAIFIAIIQAFEVHGCDYAANKLSPKADAVFENLTLNVDKLIEALPAVWVSRMTSPARRAVGKGNVKWEMSENGLYSPDVYPIFLERLKELGKDAKKLREITKADEKEKNLAAAEGLKALSFDRVPDFAKEVLQITSGASDEQARVINEVGEMIPEMSLIEAERARRILGHISEAQHLGNELEGDAALTINGRSPQEMVKEIIDGNVEELREKVLGVAAGEGAAHANATRDLEILHIYTKDLRGKN